MHIQKTALSTLIKMKKYVVGFYLDENGAFAIENHKYTLREEGMSSDSDLRDALLLSAQQKIRAYNSKNENPLKKIRLTLIEKLN